MKTRLEMASKGVRVSDGAVVTVGQVVYGTSDGRAWVVIGIDPWRESHQVLARSDDDRHQYRELEPAWLVSEPPRPAVPDAVTIPPVRPFAGVTVGKELALKPLEEAAEAFAAWQDLDLTGDAEQRNALMSECADVIQATCNLVAALGYDSMRDVMACCERRNRERGRYGDR